MPRFHLHICNGDGFTEDEEGTELEDLNAARSAAVEGLRGIMADELKSGHLNMASFIEIEDENGRLLMTVPFADAVNISTQPGRARRSAGS